MLKQIITPRFIQAALYAALGLFVLWAAVSILRPVDTVSAAPAPAPNLAPQASFTCTPVASGVFPNRIHVQCANAPITGVYFFAASYADSATASRYLSLITSAMVAGRNLSIFYEVSGNGSAWNCPPSDCRPIVGMLLLP